MLVDHRVTLQQKYSLGGERESFAQVHNITYLQGFEPEPLTHPSAVAITALHPQQTFKVEVNNVENKFSCNKTQAQNYYSSLFHFITIIRGYLQLSYCNKSNILFNVIFLTNV